MSIAYGENPMIGGNMRDQGYDRDALAARNNAKPLIIKRINSCGKRIPYFTGC